MRNTGISLLVLALWMLPFRYYYVCKIKKHCEVLTEINNPSLPNQVLDRATDLKLVEGDSVVFEDFQQFYFPPQKPHPEMTADNEAFLDLVAAYLFSHPNKQLSLTTIIQKEATATVQYTENLGDQRGQYIAEQIVQRGIASSRIRQEIAITLDSLTTGPLRFEIKPWFRPQSMR